MNCNPLHFSFDCLSKFKVRPKYKQHILALYPEDYNSPIPQNVNELINYILSQPRRLQNVGRYLYKQINKDIQRQMPKRAEVGIIALGRMMDACGSQPTQLAVFDRYIVSTVQKLLHEQHSIHLQFFALDTMIKLVQHKKGGRGRSSELRKLNVFFEYLVNLCIHTNPNQDTQNRIRLAGLFVLDKMIILNEENTPSHFNILIPAILENLQTNNISNTNPNSEIELHNIEGPLVIESRIVTIYDIHHAAYISLNKLSSLIDMTNALNFLNPIFHRLDSLQWPLMFSRYLLVSISDNAGKAKMSNIYYICSEVLKHIQSIRQSTNIINEITSKKQIISVCTQVVASIKIPIISWQQHVQFLLREIDTTIALRDHHNTQLLDALISCLGAFSHALSHSMDSIDLASAILDHLDIIMMSPNISSNTSSVTTFLRAVLHVSRVRRVLPGELLYNNIKESSSSSTTHSHNSSVSLNIFQFSDEFIKRLLRILVKVEEYDVVLVIDIIINFLIPPTVLSDNQRKERALCLVTENPSLKFHQFLLLLSEKPDVFSQICQFPTFSITQLSWILAALHPELMTVHKTTRVIESSFRLFVVLVAYRRFSALGSIAPLLFSLQESTQRTQLVHAMRLHALIASTFLFVVRIFEHTSTTNDRSTSINIYSSTQPLHDLVDHALQMQKYKDLEISSERGLLMKIPHLSLNEEPSKLNDDIFPNIIAFDISATRNSILHLAPSVEDQNELRAVDLDFQPVDLVKVGIVSRLSRFFRKESVDSATVNETDLYDDTEEDSHTFICEPVTARCVVSSPRVLPAIVEVKTTNDFFSLASSFDESLKRREQNIALVFKRIAIPFPPFNHDDDSNTKMISPTVNIFNPLLDS